MVSRKVGRRRFVAGTAAASTAFIAAPFVRGAYAAGKLSVGFWDHWVPNANGATETLVKEWAEKEKVDVQIDFITSQGNKLLLTTAAEAQAKSGHDILAQNTFLPARYADQLVPVNDVMEPLIKENGAVNATAAQPNQAALTSDVARHAASHARALARPLTIARNASTPG